MAEKQRIELPDGMRERLRDKAASLSIPVAKLVEQALEMVLGGEVQPIVTPREVTLEEAGEFLLAHVEESQASLIRDLCREHGRQPYEYLLSYVYLAHERGETATMVGETVLERQRPAAVAAIPTTTVCEWEGCRQAFIPTRRGQRFCPDPEDGSEGCGRKQSLADLHAHRAARTKRADNRYAPGQQNVEVFRRAAEAAG